MKKFFASVFVAFALIAFVACESNPGIKATKEFMKNPTEENFDKIDDIEAEMSDEEAEVFEKWWDEHEDEIRNAAYDSNPGVKAAKQFIKNPTEKNLKKVDDIVDKMNDFEVDVFDDWCDEHEDEIDDAIDSL